MQKAVGHLTDPSLTPTFPEDILLILCTHSSSREMHLPIAYFNAVSPSLSSSKVLHAYFLVICRFNITEAFYFLRSQDESSHRLLLQNLTSFVLTQKPGDKKALQASELATLPMNQSEEACFRDFLKQESDRGTKGSLDLLAMRDNLLSAKPNQPLGATSDLTQKINGIDWRTLNSTLTENRA